MYGIVLDFISHVDGLVDSASLDSFLSAYQSVTPLKLGELWAVPIMLRLALIENLRRQFAAYLGTPTRARGYPALEGTHALIVEVAPALAIERVIDLALKAVPDAEPGIHYVERQFGVLEVHHEDPSVVDRAGG